ncbi:MAG TPA: zinc-dependent peptidase, partial [Cytophagaceae bacterium]|nr:zinc-dependent peptidase [Cytophagaceae bacterium]
MIHSTLSALLFRWWYYTGGSRDIIGGEFAVLCILVIVFFMFFYYRITKRLERRRMPGGKPIKLVDPLSTAHRSILSEKSDYYNQLSKPDKELYEKRVRFYMTSKMFTAEDGYPVTDEMKVMISAAAAQITFGLPAIANSNYTHILIMPNADMTPRTASPNSIVVPWREFVAGYAHSDDG